jgi:hypothetical protein
MTLSRNSGSREQMRKLLSGLLTSNDAAKVLNSSPSVMRGLVNSGELRPLGKVGPLTVFLRDDVEALRAKRAEWRRSKS